MMAILRIFGADIGTTYRKEQTGQTGTPWARRTGRMLES
jgi:hypothetical protein